jgi:DNA replication protein DnaC
MNDTTMIEQLRELKLAGFLEGLHEQRTSSRYAELPFEERLALLVEREVMRRNDQRLQRRLKNATIRQSSATLDAVKVSAERGLSKQQILELGTCQWIRSRLSLVVSGPTGAGKSFLASALADQACRLSLTVSYARASDLIAELLLAKSDGSFRTLRKRLSKVDLLVIDDFLRDPLSAPHSREFLDLIDDRYRSASCLFVSQLAVADWHRHIADPTIADAILDRIVHDTLRVELSGVHSMRKLTSPLQSKTELHVASLRGRSKNTIEKEESFDCQT